MEYKIISRTTTKNLQVFAMEWLKLGWKPSGGICSGPDGYSQALIRRKKQVRTVFKKPTELEIASFAKDNSLALKGFYDYYQSNNWMVGRVKMKDWKAAARNWHKRKKQFNPQETATPQPKTDKQQEAERIQEWKEKGYKSEDEYNKYLFRQSPAYQHERSK